MSQGESSPDYYNSKLPDGVIKEALERLKSNEDFHNKLEQLDKNKNLEQWENDNDTDDIFLNFVERIGIKAKIFEGSTQDASLDCTKRINSRETIDTDYTIINDLHLLKNISSDKKYNLDDIKNLIIQLKDDGLHYLAGLLEYINEEYFVERKEYVSSGIKLVLFRKLLEATIPAMQHLHDTIKEKNKSNEIKKLFRVWRRPEQETYIFGKDSKLNKIITTDVFLSTSKSIEKVIEFYKNQCTGPSVDEPIIWEISMGTTTDDPIHPDSRIQASDLDELVLNMGSQLQFTGEGESTHKTKEGRSFKVKRFVYNGHIDGGTGSFYDKSSYNRAIEKFKKPRQTSSKKPKLTGGKNTQRKKEIMGRTRCIYKKPNDRKEYVKYKGELVTLKEFKNNFKKKS